jgi:hypothetical protein
MSLIVKVIFGGPERNRTDDLFHAMENPSRRLLTGKKLLIGRTGTVGVI